MRSSVNKRIYLGGAQASRESARSRPSQRCLTPGERAPQRRWLLSPLERRAGSAALKRTAPVLPPAVSFPRSPTKAPRSGERSGPPRGPHGRGRGRAAGTKGSRERAPACPRSRAVRPGPWGTWLPRPPRPHGHAPAPGRASAPREDESARGDGKSDSIGLRPARQPPTRGGRGRGPRSPRARPTPAPPSPGGARWPGPLPAAAAGPPELHDGALKAFLQIWAGAGNVLAPRPRGDSARARAPALGPPPAPRGADPGRRPRGGRGRQPRPSPPPRPLAVPAVARGGLRRPRTAFRGHGNSFCPSRRL